MTAHSVVGQGFGVGTYAKIWVFGIDHAFASLPQILDILGTFFGYWYITTASGEPNLHTADCAPLSLSSLMLMS